MYKPPRYAYIIFNKEKKVIGVITGFTKAMQYIHDNHEKGYTWKGFIINELLNQ